jgi:hypothetical protein
LKAGDSSQSLTLLSDDQWYALFQAIIPADVIAACFRLSPRSCSLWVISLHNIRWNAR